MDKFNGSNIVVADALGNEQPTEPDEPTYVLTETDLNQIISGISERFKEIIARAENVANADDKNLPLAVDALRECFADMPRDELQALAKDNH